MDAFLVVAAATVYGKLYDPLAWVMIAIVFTFGALRLQWWLAPLMAASFTAMTTIILWSWWKQIAVSWQGPVLRTSFSLLVIAFAAYGCGRLAAYIRQRVSHY